MEKELLYFYSLYSIEQKKTSYMKITEKENNKAEIKTSLSIIRFIVEDKTDVLGRKDAKTIDHHVMRILEYMEKL